MCTANPSHLWFNSVGDAELFFQGIHSFINTDLTVVHVRSAAQVRTINKWRYHELLQYHAVTLSPSAGLTSMLLFTTRESEFVSDWVSEASAVVSHGSWRTTSCPLRWCKEVSRWNEVWQDSNVWECCLASYCRPTLSPVRQCQHWRKDLRTLQSWEKF